MPIRAVLFDLGGVVLESPLHTIAAYERETGIPDGLLNRVVVENGRDGAWSRLERGEIDMETFCEDFDRETEAHGHVYPAAEVMARMGGAQIDAGQRATRPLADIAIQSDDDHRPVISFFQAASDNGWRLPGLW